MPIRTQHISPLSTMLVVGLAFVVATWPGMTAAGQDAVRAPHDPALREYLSATGLLNRGMNELAVEEYRKFLQAHGDHEKAPLARYGLAVALFRTRAFEQVVAELGQLQPPADFEFAAEVKLVLGQSHLELGQFQDAAKAFGALLQAHPDHELADDAASLWAESLYRSGQYKLVRGPVEQLVNTWPQSPLRERAEFFGALALVAQEDYAAAAKALAGLRERFPQGQFIDRVTLLLAQSLHRTGALDDAAGYYAAAIERVSGDLAAEAKFGLATLKLQQKDYEVAGTLLDQVIKDHPNHQLVGAAQLQRGRVWFELGKYDQAVAALERAEQSEHVARDETAYWLAKCQMRLGKNAEAATGLAGAIEQFPKSSLIAEMSYDHAVALKRGGDQGGAAKALAAFIGAYSEHALAPDAMYLLAVTAHEERRYAESRTTCETFLKRFGSHTLAAPVAFLAAENDFLTEQFEKALDGYQRFINAYPKDEQLDKARFRLGSSLYRLDRHDEAVQWLAQVSKGRQTPETFRRALLMLGDIAYLRGDWQKATTHLDDYLSFGVEQPSADDALLKRGLSLAMQDRHKEALADFDELLKQFPQSVHRLQAIFERGQVLLTLKDLEGAEAAFTQVLKEDGGRESRFAPYAVNHLASIAMRQQQYEKAAELYGQVAQASPKTDLAPEAMFQRGQALLAAKQFEAAADAYKAMTDQHPKSNRAPLSHAQRAIALARQGEEAEALKLMAVVERDHASTLSADVLSSMAYEKAWCFRELGKPEEAAEAYRALLASHQKLPIAAHAMLELAELESAAKRHDEAFKLLTELRTASADPAMAVVPTVKEQGTYRLAVTEFERGRFQESASLCEELIKTYPHSEVIASAHLFCGESLFKLGKSAQAAEHFAQVVKNHPDDPACASSLLRLGECHASAGRWAESEQTFRDYLGRFSESDLWFQAQFGTAFALENQQKHEDAKAEYRKVIDRHSGPTAARAQFQIGECLFAQKQYEHAVRELLKVDILYGYPEWSAAALYEAGRCFEELAKPIEARSQFEQVQEKYPETQWAKLAAQRLTALSSRSTGGG